MAITYASQRAVSLAASHAFALVAVPSQRRLWLPASSRDELSGDVPPSVGASFACTRSWSGELLSFQAKVEAVDAPNEYRVKLRHPDLVVNEVFRVTPYTHQPGLAVLEQLEIAPLAGASAVDVRRLTDASALRSAIELTMDRFYWFAEWGETRAPAPWPVVRHTREIKEVSERTFQELGVDVPLFAATIGACSDYVGRQTCAATGTESEHCFLVDALLTECAGCSRKVYQLDHTEACPFCARALRPWKGKGKPPVGHEALRSGLGAFVVDTEYGMVTPNLALLGRTHPTPCPPARPEFPLVTSEGDGEEDDVWQYANVPVETLTQLVRTPPFHAWNETSWLFHCKTPMTYLKQRGTGRTAKHVFRCGACGKERAT